LHVRSKKKMHAYIHTCKSHTFVHAYIITHVHTGLYFFQSFFFPSFSVSVCGWGSSCSDNGPLFCTHLCACAVRLIQTSQTLAHMRAEQWGKDWGTGFQDRSLYDWNWQLSRWSRH